MAYPLEMPISEADTIRRAAKRIVNSGYSDSDTKAASILMLKVYPDYATPAIGSLEKLRDKIEEAFQVGDVYTLSLLHYGIAKTVVDMGRLLKRCSAKTRNIGEVVRYYTWWCQIFVDYERMTGISKLRKAA